MRVKGTGIPIQNFCLDLNDNSEDQQFITKNIDDFDKNPLCRF